MDKLRNVADGIGSFCSGAETNKEYCDGVNILLGRMGFDMKSESAQKILTRIDAKLQHRPVVNDENKFLRNLFRKPVQYSKLPDADVQKILKTVLRTRQFNEAEESADSIINDVKKYFDVAFKPEDKSHFICVYYEAIGVEVPNNISEGFFNNINNESPESSHISDGTNHEPGPSEYIPS